MEKENKKRIKKAAVRKKKDLKTKKERKWRKERKKKQRKEKVKPKYKEIKMDRDTSIGKTPSETKKREKKTKGPEKKTKRKKMNQILWGTTQVIKKKESKT